MFTKQYLKTKDVCRVRFKVQKKVIGTAKKVNLVGDFNNWDENGVAMKKLKSGDFSTVLDLELDRSYQFRYLVDDTRWINDESADVYLPSPYKGEDNSVITI
ncbi:MAG: isoamylase early set domain-containing protein [Desulfobacterales bacterium]|nr:isoamylase early set domain-containing protein [Desulfobacterales bacterium]